MTCEQFEGYDRISSILSPFSGLSNVPKAILDRACKRGTAVHAAINCFFDKISIDDDEWDNVWNGYLMSFNLWKSVENLEIIERPKRWFCQELLITGEVDLVNVRDGKTFIIDFKTSSKEGKTWDMQGTAYQYLAMKNGYDPSGVRFVHLDKNGGFGKVYGYKYNLPKFLNLLEIYREYFKELPEVYYE